MKQILIPILASLLILSVPGCFGDTPVEPDEEPAEGNRSVGLLVAATDLGTLGGNASAAYGINAGGQIIGASQTNAGEYHAFLWQNGTMTDLGTLGGPRSGAQGINDAGHVVGWSFTEPFETSAFIWQSGSMHALVSDARCGADGNAVNASGEVRRNNLRQRMFWTPSSLARREL